MTTFIALVLYGVAGWFARGWTDRVDFDEDEPWADKGWIIPVAAIVLGGLVLWIF